jgi:hypothetical protein
MIFGEDYRAPCLNYAIDSLNDVATYYNAYDFSTQSDVISIYMSSSLNSTLYEKCYLNLQSFAISGVDLPNDFESAIQETQVQQQMIATT